MMLSSGAGHRRAHLNLNLSASRWYYEANPPLKETTVVTAGSQAEELQGLKAPFARAWAEPAAQAQRWRDRGGRVMGIFWDYVPEELIHAAGFLPYRVLGSTENISEADRYMPTYICVLMRSALDQALKGGYSFLDGLVVAPFWCEAMKPLYELWRTHAPRPFMEALDLPGVTGAAGFPYFEREVLRFKGALEAWSGREITPQALAHSVRLYNEGRRLHRRLFCLRQGRLSCLSSMEWAEVVLSSMVMPREEHNLRLARLVDALEDLPEDAGEGPLRLHLSGTVIVDLNFFRVVDEVGGSVTSDDLYTGTRWYWDLVDENVPPLEGVIQRYWAKLPCSARSMPRVRLNQVLDFIKMGRGQGTVLLTEKHCDPHIFEDPLLKEWLEEAGIPCLQLDTELALRGPGQVRTRLQTFVEMARKRDGS